MNSIFISNPITNGHSWTITSKLGDILSVAEKKNGTRDLTYTILGVEVNQVGHPRIWFPEDCKHAIIQISMNCLNDMNRAVFQVAYEAIHCLILTGSNSVNALEKGLANLFSIEYALVNDHGIWTSCVSKYTMARDLVEQLIGLAEDAIKKLWHYQPCISLIDKELILKTISNIPEDLAENLTMKFYLNYRNYRKEIHQQK